MITAGMGAPFLGDYQGVDEVREEYLVMSFSSLPQCFLCESKHNAFVAQTQETGKFMFSLEANNLVDENGESKQTKMPYFENGWVEEKDESRSGEGGGFKFPWQK